MDFPELRSFGVTAVSTAGIIIVVNFVGHLTGWGSRYFGFGVSLVISPLIWYFMGDPQLSDPKWLRIVLATGMSSVLNYMTAYGVNKSIIREIHPDEDGDGDGQPLSQERRGFWSPW